ncbi:MAG TPA: asparagine synthase (glutamine-hydrolyzing), partial [Acidobacteriota bacterium]|nr:asparagine synthase (glutamine-hydrolyzing) [Acidobacteriota bacterium]
SVSEDSLNRATKTLEHRGPDGQKIWISPNRKIGLGHARLSIIDLTTGDQPIANETNTIHIVVNGEFYDYERIQRELQQRGHQLRTKSDSEIALHLYEELGTHCLEHLRGEFAFVLWDEPNQTLFAARDRFGIKPLFYTIHNDILYFASEVKALFAAGVPAAWNQDAFFHAADIGNHPAQTLYKNIFQIPPAHYLITTSTHLSVQPYWDFNYPRLDQPQRAATEQEYAESFRRELEEAVRIRLRADVPVGCYLSGGLDSCSVIGLASLHHPEPIRAFTLTFDHPQYNEEAVAREMAAHANAEFYPIPISQSDLADNFADSTWNSETFCVNAHGVAKFVLSRAVRKAGYKVVLTGEGSDEILGGYPHFRRDMLLYNNQGQDPKEVQKLLAQLNDANPVSRGLLLPEGETLPLDSVKNLLGFVPSWIETFSGRAYKLHELFSSDFTNRFAGRDSYRPLLNSIDYWKQLKNREPVNQSLYLWSKTGLPAYILTILGDRMEMAHSIEGRVPFLDHRVVECVSSMPVSLKIRGMTEKYILRQAARSVITDSVYNRQKHPFLSPPATLNPDDGLSNLMQDTLRGASLKSLSFFNRDKVIAILDGLPNMDDGQRTVVDQVLMLILSACILQDRFHLGS